MADSTPDTLCSLTMPSDPSQMYILVYCVLPTHLPCPCALECKFPEDRDRPDYLTTAGPVGLWYLTMSETCGHAPTAPFRERSYVLH